jgi:L-amino acid N-acyltransferase YncA
VTQRPASNPRELSIRPARIDDAAAMLAIYAPLVEQTAISFEVVPPSLAEFQARIDKASAGWAWLVAERAGHVIGYAYGSLHRERAAYATSTDVSAYVAAAARGQGVGRRLYEALLPTLANSGYCMAFAGITLPNDASVALHRAVGFAPVGVFPRAGRKFGVWRDVAWFQRRLRDEPLPA